MGRPQVQGTEQCTKLHPGLKCDIYTVNGRTRCRSYNRAANAKRIKKIRRQGAANWMGREYYMY